jgi:hypothetical protein
VHKELIESFNQPTYKEYGGQEEITNVTKAAAIKFIESFLLLAPKAEPEEVGATGAGSVSFMWLIKNLHFMVEVKEMSHNIEYRTLEGRDGIFLEDNFYYNHTDATTAVLAFLANTKD